MKMIKENDRMKRDKKRVPMKERKKKRKKILYLLKNITR
jgi:hypothetical protein